MQPGWGGVGRVREEGKATSDVPRESRRGRAWRYPRWGVGRGQHLAIKWRRVRKIVVPFRAPHTDQSDPSRAVERRTWVVIVGFPPPISTGIWMGTDLHGGRPNGLPARYGVSPLWRLVGKRRAVDSLGHNQEPAGSSAFDVEHRHCTGTSSDDPSRASRISAIS
jgi:hypothetical protein